MWFPIWPTFQKMPLPRPVAWHVNKVKREEIMASKMMTKKSLNRLRNILNILEDIKYFCLPELIFFWILERIK